MSVVRKRTERTARRLTCFAVAALLALPGLALADPFFILKTTVTITGAALASFDISWVDPETHTYTLSDRSNKAVDVINTETLAQTKLLPGQFAGTTTTPVGLSTTGLSSCPPNACDGPNGNLVFNNNGVEEVWAGDGATQACTGRETPTKGIVTQSQIQALNYSTNCSTVKVINLNTGKLIAEIPTGGLFRDDELCYDPVDHLIQIANDSDLPYPYINFISTDTYKVVRQVNFDGLPGDGPAATNGIEQCQWIPANGMIYRNVPEVNGDGNDDAPGQVVIFDPKTLNIVNQFVIPLAQCAGPQGMALGPFPQIMEGCNAKGPPEVSTSTGAPPCTISGGVPPNLTGNCTGSGPQNTVVIDERNGSVLATLANQGGNDEVWFNPRNGLYFLAEGSNATQEQLGIVTSFPFFINTIQDIVVANPPGTGHAHSVAADQFSGEVYYPIPNNVDAATVNAPNPCPTPAQGCVAIYASQF
jgi:hypothetical protein